MWDCATCSFPTHHIKYTCVTNLGVSVWNCFCVYQKAEHFLISALEIQKYLRLHLRPNSPFLPTQTQSFLTTSLLSPSLLCCFPSLTTGGRREPVQYGANINGKGILKMTVLHLAKLLLRYGADVHCLSRFSKKAFDIATLRWWYCYRWTDGGWGWGGTLGEGESQTFRQSWGGKNRMGQRHLMRCEESDRQMKGRERRGQV